MITQEFKNQVVEALKRAAEQTSQNKLAQAIKVKEGNFSPAMLSQMINGNHELISEEMWMRAANFLGLTRNAWPTVDTANRQAIMKLCDDAILYQQLVAVSAPTGLGKSATLQEFAKRNPKDVVYVHFMPLMSRLECLEHIATAIGLNTKGTPAKLMLAIAQRIKTKKLLILDDVDKVITEFSASLQGIYDQCEGQVGIVIAGTQVLKNQIERKAAQLKRNFPELYRRISYWQPLYKPSADAVTGMAKANGITDEKAIDFLIGKADNYGTIRNYITAAKKTNKPINRALLANLNIGSTNWIAN